MNPYLPIYFFIASAVCSLLVLFQPERKMYWVFIPYLTLIASLETYSQYLSDHRIYNLWVANIMSACSVVFYIFITCRFLANRRIKITGYILSACFALFFIASCLWITPITTLHDRELSVGYFLVVCFCIYYVYELLSVPNNVQLLRSPAFWIVTGALFNHAGQLPVYLFVNFIVKQKFISVLKIFDLVHFMDIILNVLLIIAFICRLVLPKRFLSYS